MRKATKKSLISNFILISNDLNSFFQIIITCVRLLFFSFSIFIGDFDGEDDDGRRVVSQRFVDSDLTRSGINAEGRSIIVGSLKKQKNNRKSRV